MKVYVITVGFPSIQEITEKKVENLQHWHEVVTFATKFIPQMNFFGVLPPLRMLRLDPWNLKQVMLAKG